jgi:hypothetical protein
LGASGLSIIGGVNLFSGDPAQLSALLSNSGNNQPATGIQSSFGTNSGTGNTGNSANSATTGGGAGTANMNAPGGTGVSGGLFAGLGAAGVGALGGQGGIGSGTGGGIGSGTGSGSGSGSSTNAPTQAGLSGGRGSQVGGRVVTFAAPAAFTGQSIAATTLPSFRRVEVVSEGVRLPEGVDPVACRVSQGVAISVADALDSMLQTCSR